MNKKQNKKKRMGKSEVTKKCAFDEIDRLSNNIDWFINNWLLTLLKYLCFELLSIISSKKKQKKTKIYYFEILRALW